MRCRESALDEATREVFRLISLSESDRDSEGVYANTKQLEQMLRWLKKVEKSSSEKVDSTSLFRMITDSLPYDGKLSRLFYEIKDWNDESKET